MSLQAFREIVSRLTTPANACAALGAALDARTSGVPLDPRIEGHVNEVLDALGARELVATLSPAELGPVLAEIRITLGYGADMTWPAKRTIGWSLTDPDHLQLAGDFSASFAHAVKNMIAPNLAGLAERLESGEGAFLDVGVGVAGIAIEMARVFPKLRVVGIDLWAPSLALARDNIRRAGLAERIELREQGAQHLTDERTFDLAWIPSTFVSGDLLGTIAERIHHALRPGGWFLFAAINTNLPDPLAASFARLRTVMFGGKPIAPSEAEEILNRAGFRDIRTLPAPPTAVAIMTVGRRTS